MTLPPELIVTVEKVSADPQDDQFLAVTSRSNGAEVCRNLFHFRLDLLVDFEPQWMLEKAVPRHAGEAIKREFPGSVTAFGEGGCCTEIHGQHHVLQCGQGRKQLEELEYHTNGPPTPDSQLIFTEFFNLVSVNKDLSFGRTVKSCNHVN